MSNVEEAKVAREKLDTWLELLTHNNLPITGLLFFFLRGGGWWTLLGSRAAKSIWFYETSMIISRDVLHFMVSGRSDWKRAPGWCTWMIWCIVFGLWHFVLIHQLCQLYSFFFTLSAVFKSSGSLLEDFLEGLCHQFPVLIGKAMWLQSTCMFLEMQLSDPKNPNIMPEHGMPMQCSCWWAKDGVIPEGTGFLAVDKAQRRDGFCFCTSIQTWTCHYTRSRKMYMWQVEKDR